MPEYVPPVGDEPDVWIHWPARRKCEHRKQGRTPGDRYWVCLDCGALIDGGDNG